MGFLSDAQREMLKVELARVIGNGNFKQLCIQQHKEDGGYSCAIEGDLFCIIGALAHVMHDFHKQSSIPVHVLCTYLELATEIVQQVSAQEQKEQCGDDETFTQFMDILTGKQEDK